MSIFTLCLLVASAEAFSFASSPLQSRTAVIQQTRHRSVAAVVVDITSTDEFNNALETAGDSLVVIDYSTSWCGPCKIIAPKYDELSEQYKNVAFLKVKHTGAKPPVLTVALPCASTHLLQGPCSRAADKGHRP